MTNIKKRFSLLVVAIWTLMAVAYAISAGLIARAQTEASQNRSGIATTFDDSSSS